MTITELLKVLNEKEFKTSIYGYDIEQVNKFFVDFSSNLYSHDIEFQKISNDYETLQKKYIELKQDAEKMKFDLKKQSDIIKGFTNGKK
ncbi:hypothetical protein [Mycoplasmopsis alligatoris]|uniref:Conserved domain protein n=1 Tax=Mycoplasmopsis alligatoris A21JP2 TaxID=747682 RepID=D4XWB3_9BACT|nr:hypothetical protein [Mycoplasmopsis alligatoris]EFF41335.1 conserved domain protein [Mycoplasmopsis alligatoris A21JP2]